MCAGKADCRISFASLAACALECDKISIIEVLQPLAGLFIRYETGKEPFPC